MKKKQSLQRQKKIYLLIFSLLLCSPFYTKNTIVEYKNYSTEKAHPIFHELIAKLENEECLQLNITAVATKKNASYAYSYTSHGIGLLLKESTRTIKSSEIRMAFSDRSFFNGKKTIEVFRIIDNGNSVMIEIKYKTWSNTVVLLTSVKISKNKFGFYITGNFSNNSKTSYYTLSIYEVACLL